jgi:hypothetical protein
MSSSNTVTERKGGGVGGSQTSPSLEEGFKLLEEKNLLIERVGGAPGPEATKLERA